MFGINRFRSVPIMIVAILIIFVSQITYGLTCLDAPVIPQWVLDRQQYEPTYTYTSEQSTEGIASAGIADRLQYDPGYLDRESRTPQTTNTSVPQWVLDRQQYEPTYEYIPSNTTPYCSSLEIT